MRVGLGIDVHAFAAPEDGRRLVLGGVEIPSDRGLLGHSDADVLAHAVTDALLGAAGLEDIGHYFPDTDERYRDADSIELLREVRGLVGESWEVSNVDAVVVCERPKIRDHREAMRANLAAALGVDGFSRGRTRHHDRAPRVHGPRRGHSRAGGVPAGTAMIRVRFAPSPTGLLHIGGARTALFNYLFARHYGGGLILRIEDTDRERSLPEFEQAQLEDLAWLGLSFDEGPYHQSERGEVYERAVQRLADSGLTYESADEAGRRALYFRPPERSGSFVDGLRGEVTFGGVEDFVILKSDGTPSYNFAVVVDDADMEITHVIRGEEHLSNTARQGLLYEALGVEKPQFVHLGVILGPDGKKLSKRHGAASIADYRERGYLPEALVNYLALLGWNHPEGKEEFSDLDELVRDWDPSRLGASPATFDPDRLLLLRRPPHQETARGGASPASRTFPG